jgi:uncharacterized protein (DUF2384 family)
MRTLRLTAEDKEEAKRIFTEAPRASSSRVDLTIDVTARAVEVLGSREKALRWLRTPVRSLGDLTPLALLDPPGGIERVQDASARWNTASGR